MIYYPDVCQHHIESYWITNSARKHSQSFQEFQGQTVERFPRGSPQDSRVQRRNFFFATAFNGFDGFDTDIEPFWTELMIISWELIGILLGV